MSCPVLDLKWKRVCYGSTGEYNKIAIIENGQAVTFDVLREFPKKDTFKFKLWNRDRLGMYWFHMKKENEID